MTGAKKELERLFDSFVEEHAAGRRPDPRTYMQLAGPLREPLGRLLDGYLAAAPIDEPDAEELALMTARVEHVTPLRAARTRCALQVDEVVERLREALALGESSRARLRAAYEELEAEQLDPAGVHERVWKALRGILGLDARWVAGAVAPWRKAAANHRLADSPFAPLSAPAREDVPASPAADEIDLLFRRGGRGDVRMRVV